MIPNNPQNLYFELCKKFYYKNVRKRDMTFSCFYDDVGYPTIEEATKKSYSPDGRFYKLLNFRFIDFKRKPKKTVNLTDYIMLSAKSFGNTPLEKSMVLIDQLIELVEKGEFNEQQIGEKLIKIANDLEIEFFLGIPIEEILCIQKSGNTTSANQSYHRHRFTKTLSKISIKSLSTIPINETDYSNVNEESIELFKLGSKNKVKAKELVSSKTKSDYTLLFMSILLFLKASIYFKEAISLDVEFAIAKYNYAYTLKRLGKFDVALDYLQDLESQDFDMVQKKSMILESIGDIYLMKKEYKDAEDYFKSALDLTPKDQEIALNLLKIYKDTKKIFKIDETLDLLFKIKKENKLLP